MRGIGGFMSKAFLALTIAFAFFSFGQSDISAKTKKKRRIYNSKKIITAPKKRASRKPSSVISPQLPSAQELRDLPLKQRQQYLRGLVKIANKKGYAFLDSFLMFTSAKLVKKCLTPIYGPNAWITNTDKNSRIFCKQDLKKASAQFVHPQHTREWTNFAIKIKILCFKSKSCKNFVKEQDRLKKKVFASPAAKWVVKR